MMKNIGIFLLVIGVVILLVVLTSGSVSVAGIIVGAIVTIVGLVLILAKPKPEEEVVVSEPEQTEPVPQAEETTPSEEATEPAEAEDTETEE